MLHHHWVTGYDLSSHESIIKDGRGRCRLIASCLPNCAVLFLLQNMLLRKLWENQQEQERQQAATSPDGDMEVDDNAAPVLQKSGTVQKELVDWFLEKQLQRCVLKHRVNRFTGPL